MVTYFDWPQNLCPGRNRYIIPYCGLISLAGLCRVLIPEGYAIEYFAPCPDLDIGANYYTMTMQNHEAGPNMGSTGYVA